MEQTTFTYEAREQMLVIHLPKELDHHNCRNLKRDTDLLLAENYINRIVFDFTHTSFTVSYTHLDVYKRQSQGPAGII